MSSSEFRQNEIHIKGCGTDFINGVYTRSEQNQFSKQFIHPHSNKITTLEIRKQTNVHSLSIPQSLYNKNDEIYVISSINPSIHYYLCILSINNIHEQKSTIKWTCAGGIEPVPIISPINNIKTYFDISFINNDNIYYKTKTIKTNATINDKQLVKASNIHSHFKKYKPAIKSSWIELAKGLKGGQCLKMEVNRQYKIWDILREISSMNKLVSTWNIRLKHIKSGLYVHYLWHYNLFEIIQCIENKQLNKDILNNKFAFYSKKYLICYYSHYDDTYSYQTRYLPCYDNIKVLKNMIDKHEEYLNKYDNDNEDTGSDQKEIEHEQKQDIEIEIDDRYKHQFIAERIWDKREINIHYGDKKQSILLEDCCCGCKCWSDDISGCRIAHIIEHIFNISIDKQGWIVNSQIIDYFDEHAAEMIFSSDSNIILYSKLT